jgi:hypothetical protein
MTHRDPEKRSFALDEAERVSRDLPGQIARLRAEVDVARARLSKTAREQARDDADEGKTAG